jgi:hypothetical protein
VVGGDGWCSHEVAQRGGGSCVSVLNLNVVMTILTPDCTLIDVVPDWHDSAHVGCSQRSRARRESTARWRRSRWASELTGGKVGSGMVG